MTEYKKGPSWATFFYHSQFAPHTLTIPTRQWDNSIGTSHGGFTNWGDGDVAAEDMYDEIINALIAFWPTSVVVDQVITYNQVGETESGVPVDIYVPVDIVGTDGSPGWYQAVQTTLSMYDTDFHEMRITMLDSASHNSWLREPPGALAAAGVALVSVLVSDLWAWSSRFGSQPNTARGITRTLNEALRHSYGMG